MKQKTEGRRFSKRRVTEFKSDSDFVEHIKEHGKPLTCDDGRVAYQIGNNWNDIAESAIKAGSAYLAAAGLPATYLLWKHRDSDAWVTEKPTLDQFRGRKDIATHVRDLGYPRDSLEDIAARLITTANQTIDCFDNGRINTAMNECLKLGKTIALAKVYDIESAAARNSAKRDRKEKELIALSKQLASEYDRFPDAWNAIPEDDSNDDDIYRDGDKLIWYSAFHDGAIKKESFRTGYFIDAKKGKL